MTLVNGIDLRVRQTPGGLFVREIALSRDRCREALAGRSHIVRAMTLNDQAVALDLSMFRDAHAVADALVGLRDRFCADGLFTNCAFQISCAQAFDSGVQRALAGAEVNVRLTPAALADSTVLACCERLAGWCCVFPGRVTPTCNPLGAEAATAVLPGIRLMVPDTAAVLVVSLNVAALLHGSEGSVEHLASATRTAVALADRAFDELRWPLASLTADAYMNRRVAIVPGGLGDALVDAGHDPARGSALDWLASVVKTIVSAARAESRRAARQRGRFPGMQARHVFAHLDDKCDRKGWQRRWEQAVQPAPYRNRHLIFVNLDSLWPMNDPKTPVFSHLLPVLSQADGFGFGPFWPSIGDSAGQRLKWLRHAHALISRG